MLTLVQLLLPPVVVVTFILVAVAIDSHNMQTPEWLVRRRERRQAKKRKRLEEQAAIAKAQKIEQELAAEGTSPPNPESVSEEDPEEIDFDVVELVEESQA